MKPWSLEVAMAHLDSMEERSVLAECVFATPRRKPTLLIEKKLGSVENERDC